jgi:hypothetical protein
VESSNTGVQTAKSTWVAKKNHILQTLEIVVPQVKRWLMSQSQPTDTRVTDNLSHYTRRQDERQ